MTIGPVVLFGTVIYLFMLTTVHSSMMEEIEEGLKGTAAATLAAYDQNTGDIWNPVMATSGKAAIISPILRAWWIGSGTIQEWM